MSAYLQYALGILLLTGLVASSIRLARRRRDLREFYDSRGPLYRDWLELYGDAAKPKVQLFLRCFGDSFHVPRDQFHKLGPGDGVMDYYHWDYPPGEVLQADGLETETFVRRLEDAFGYKAVEADGKLTMSELFEKATGARRQAPPTH